MVQQMLGSTIHNVTLAKWLLPFVLIGSAGAIAIWHVSESRGAVGTVSPRQNAPDPSSILADRSPGARDAGALFQTKPLANLLDAAQAPNAPASNLIEPSPLPAIEDMPRAFSAIVPPAEEGAPGAAPLGVPIGVPVSRVSGPAPTPISSFLPVPLPPLISPFLQVPVGGTPPVTDVPVGSFPAAPEPASWATMLVGFGLIGGMMRRRRPVAALNQ